MSWGLYYYGYRYLDSQSGRFMTVDRHSPVYVNPQTLNQYIYALDNPNRYNDPTGAISKQDTMTTPAQRKQQQEEDEEDARHRKDYIKLLMRLSTTIITTWGLTTTVPSVTTTTSATTVTTTWITSTTPTTTPQPLQYSNPSTITSTETTWGLTFGGSIVVNPQESELVIHISEFGLDLYVGLRFGVGEGPILEALICKSVGAPGTPGCPDPTIY